MKLEQILCCINIRHETLLGALKLVHGVGMDVQPVANTLMCGRGVSQTDDHAREQERMTSGATCTPPICQPERCTREYLSALLRPYEGRKVDVASGSGVTGCLRRRRSSGRHRGALLLATSAATNGYNRWIGAAHTSPGQSLALTLGLNT